EVIMLAKKSLACISKDYILDLSSAAFVGGLFENRAIPYDVREQLLTCVSGKNPHDLARICRENGIDDDTRAKLTTISETYGKVEDVIAALRPLAENDTMTSALDELEAIYNFMTAVGEGDNLRLDFSLINDMSYYDGIIFRGYIDGVARGVLSGGRYDKLLDKMGKHTGAIGFAIYMNTLDLYFEDKNEYDVDILITYDDTADLAALTRTVKMLTGGGRSVRVQKTSDGTLKCREHFRYGEGGLDIETT
ncbi:MAG: ATP phosphoribosyltransferase regulatory subunit, partial [Clostridia bacterium]|nr:ATP phosphoribosyltransferase regulatory subunit [Clostridia bacterium]